MDAIAIIWITSLIIAVVVVGVVAFLLSRINNTAKEIDTAAANQLNSNVTAVTNGTNVSQTVIGTTLNVSATGVNTLFGTQKSLFATLTIVGRDSGARVQVPVTINKSANTTAA